MPRKSNKICELTILGSGSGIPVIDRASSAILVNADGRLHLLDCGEGITSTLLNKKIPYNQIETIFITHGHPDHCSGLPLLLQLMHVNKREKELKIFLPEEAVDPTMRYLWHCYLFPEHLTFQYHLLKLDDQNPHTENGVEITAHANSHLTSYRGIILEHSYSNMMQCYSLSLKVGDKKIVYSSDLASAGDLGDFARGADVLIVEGLHIEPEELFRVIAEWKVGKVVMTHFAPRWDKKEKALVALAKRFGVRNFKLAEDGMKVR